MRNKQTKNSRRAAPDSPRPAARDGGDDAAANKRLSPVFGWLPALVYLFAITIVCYIPALLPGQTFLTADLVMLMPPWAQHAAQIAPPGWHMVARPAWDPLFQFYASRKFLAQSVHAGVVPWHNPYSNSGTPFIADDQSAFFYPINWLFALLPLASAFGIVSALHTFLAGVFFALLARTKRLAWEASLAGATVWMLCGTMVAWQMWQVVDATLCWLPLALYFADRIIDPDSASENSNRCALYLPTIGLAVSVGMILLAGHLQFGFCDLLVICFYAAVSLWRRQSMRPAVPVLCGLVLGFAIAAAQVIPTLDLLQNSLRSNYTIEELLQTALPPTQLALAVMPEIAGGERDWPVHPFEGAVNYYEVTCYVGAAALVFAALAILAASRERRLDAWFWVAIAVLGVLIGCGTPVYRLLYYGLPLFKSFHGVARTLVLADFAVAMLCALGIQALVDRGDDRQGRSSVLRAGGAVALAVIALYGIIASRSSGLLAPLLTHEWLDYGLAQLAKALGLVLAATVVAAFAPRKLSWLAVGVVALDMLWFASGLNPGAPADMLYPKLPVIYSIKQIAADGRVLTLGEGGAFTRQMVPNTAMSLGLNDIQGSDPLLLENYDRFSTLVNAATALTPLTGDSDSFVHGDCAALNYLNVRALISPVRLTGAQYPVWVTNEVGVYANPDAVGEARLAGSWTVNTDDRAGWLRILAPNPGPTVFVSEAPRFGNRTLIPGMPMHGDAGSVQSATHGLETADASITTPEPDVVVFSEIADPAWKAFLDGRPADWLTVDGLFVGVPVSAGAHAVHLQYLPGAGILGLYLTCGAWLVAAYWLAAAYAVRAGRERPLADPIRHEV